jgi:hypothetical protein
MDKITETIKNVLGVLLEGRLEDVKAKYSDAPNSETIIDTLSGADPSGNNKYLDWMAKVSFSDVEDFSLEDITSVVKAYHENLQRLTSQISTPIVDANKTSFPGRAERRIKNNPKDISGYPTLSSLKLITTALEETKKERPDRDRIYQDDRWTVVVPKTHQAACKYGVHSNWCVSTSNSTYFGRYTKERDALLFFILWRNKRETTDKTEYKVAINAKFKDWEDPHRWDWYDMPDHNMDSNLMLNIFPKSMIEKVQRYLVSEGKKQGKIVDKAAMKKLIDDNSVYQFGDYNGQTYFTTNNVQAFSNLPGYSRSFRYSRNPDNINSRNAVIYVSNGGDFGYNNWNVDLWSEGRQRRNNQGETYMEPRALEAYQSWKRHYSHNKDFVSYVMSLPEGLTIPDEIRNEIETKAREDLAPIRGMWVQTRTRGLNVGDTVRWKKGRGYWQQRGAEWNESTIDRQTPAGFFVTGKTDEYPKGKRFKPSNNTSMDVWHEFDDNIDLSATNQ